MPSFFAKAAALVGLVARNVTVSPGSPSNVHGAPVGWALSKLGTHSLNLPSFLTNNPLPQSHPWGSRTSQNTNYYNDYPDTGVTRYYTFNITQGQIAPDGVSVPGFLVNGQFPGPLIEANWGDWFQIDVQNNLPYSLGDGLSLHWHGQLQKGTVVQDGVPGIGQCPIAPGQSLTYRFQAQLYGTSWWHSHYSSQYASGMSGPMVIYGPTNVDYDIDVGPIMLSDWYHEFYQDGVDQVLAPLPASGYPSSNNNLINGKNNYDCSLTSLPCVSNAGLASFNFTAGKTHRLRLINPGAAGTQKFSIDGHTMTVIANDYVEVQPYETQVVTLGVGQRTDVIVKATGNPGSSYWMRSFIPPNSGRTDANQWNEVQAAIYYNGANTNSTPTSSPVAGYNSYYLGNDPLSETVPVYPMPVGNAATTDTIVIDLGSNGTHLLWYQNNQTFRTDYNDPVTFQAKMGNLSYPPIRSVHNYGSNASVRFIVENHSGFVHPMHLHGHNMFILAEGYCTNQADDSSLTSLAATGTMNTDIITAEVTVSPLPTSASNVALTKRASNGTSTSMSASASASTHSGNATTTSFGIPSQAAYTASPSQVCWDGTINRASNPQRRDVQQLLPGGYIVVQWNQDNPGIWPFHCHIAWHISAGFLWNVLEQPDQIKRGVNIPSSFEETCAQWDTYSNRVVIDQIDSGQ